MKNSETPCEPIEIDTIYIGGGTPSVMPAEDICRILEKIHKTFRGSPRETTMEMNPDDITPELIKKVKSAGVNRVSIGIQTFNDNRLKFLRRRHSALQACRAIDTIRKEGIGNVSVDLMFGFPNETMRDWEEDIEQALKLNPSHISAYCLMYEEGTPLYRLLEEHKVEQIDDETYLAMYTMLIDRLQASGYEHYEISNFAQPGHRSIHNSSYWRDIPYMGFGASAHSYSGKKRSWNVDNLKRYIESIEHDVLPSTSETIDSDTHYNDLVTTALRTCEGLNLAWLDDDHAKYALQCAQMSIDNGLLEIANNHLRLTRKGIFISDSVMSDLMKV